LELRRLIEYEILKCEVFKGWKASLKPPKGFYRNITHLEQSLDSSLHIPDSLENKYRAPTTTEGSDVLDVDPKVTISVDGGRF